MIAIVLTVIALKWVELEMRISAELGQQSVMELDYRISALIFFHSCPQPFVPLIPSLDFFS